MRIIALGMALACGTASAQVAGTANTAYKTAEGRKGMMQTLGDPHRADRLKAPELVKTLDLKSCDTVADVGSGAGVLLPYFSKAVGACGRVIAMDIFRDFLDSARRKATEDGLGNVMFVLGTDKDTRLPENCCDVAVTVDAYHHYDYPAETLATIRGALRPGGRFVILDYYKRPNAMGKGNFALEHIRVDRDDVVKEVEAAGFRLIEVREHVPDSQYIAVFGAR